MIVMQKIFAIYSQLTSYLKKDAIIIEVCLSIFLPLHDDTILVQHLHLTVTILKDHCIVPASGTSTQTSEYYLHYSNHQHKHPNKFCITLMVASLMVAVHVRTFERLHFQISDPLLSSSFNLSNLSLEFVLQFQLVLATSVMYCFSQLDIPLMLTDYFLIKFIFCLECESFSISVCIHLSVLPQLQPILLCLLTGALK